MTLAMTEQNKKSIRKNRKGFTLIELIVVIAILAILAAIAIPAFTGTLNNAKDRADDATERVITSAVKLYYAENGSYPANLAALTANSAYLDGSNLRWARKDVPITEISVSTSGVVTFTPTKEE
jgi:prepilin-type N-terminal cleavage/methylation domain-containing protein